ncbi:hypothetical protein IMCC12053_611 [Celeribacter marinus]|uniref:Uncharacterized protein n=1 Tax=Celeribacter marinus TaxID=1397108 RepID=A0A0N9ZML6_9RHOB|nr:hypothetical protein IMCC12053_611 [Celeribacter marinus]
MDGAMDGAMDGEVEGARWTCSDRTARQINAISLCGGRARRQ